MDFDFNVICCFFILVISIKVGFGIFFAVVSSDVQGVSLIYTDCSNNLMFSCVFFQHKGSSVKVVVNLFLMVSVSL